MNNMVSVLFVVLLFWWDAVAATQDLVQISTTTARDEDNFGPKQPRYWPKYSGKRCVELLDGTWEMGQLGSIEHPPSFDSMDPLLSPSTLATPNTTQIPSCVDNAPPGYLGYRGVSFFRTHFDYDLSKAPARLLFQACSFYCRVWVNGKEIGHHLAGGYVAFWLDIPMLEAGTNEEAEDDVSDLKKHELFVLVDNRFNSTTAPLQ